MRDYSWGSIDQLQISTLIYNGEKAETVLVDGRIPNNYKGTTALNLENNVLYLVNNNQFISTGSAQRPFTITLPETEEYWSAQATFTFNGIDNSLVKRVNQELVNL